MAAAMSLPCSAFGPARARLRHRAPLARPLQHPPRAMAGLDRSNPDGGKTDWREMYEVLTDYGIKALDANEVNRRLGRGKAVVVDVRIEKESRRACILDSLVVPLYQPISGLAPYKIARRAAFLAFGVVEATELNADFCDEVRQYIGVDVPVILVCGIGGTLEADGSYPYGRRSRSLEAAYYLLQEGFRDVSILDGGISAWGKAGFDVYAMD